MRPSFPPPILLAARRPRSATEWVLTLLLCPDQCTMAWLWAESPVSANEVLGSRSSSAAAPPARGAFTSSRRPLATWRFPLEPSAKAVAQLFPRSRALGGCARRLLLAPPDLPGARMSCSHRAPAGDGPAASPCFFPPLPPPGWGRGSGPDRCPSAASLRAVPGSSGHWLANDRGVRGGRAGGREAGAAGRPGPPVAPQVISAPARTHVDRSRSPVRARGAPGQPAGRSVRAASIPLRLPRLGLPSVWRPPRCGSGAGGVRAPTSRRASVCWGSGEGVAGKEGAPAGAPRGSSPLFPPRSRSLALSSRG